MNSCSFVGRIGKDAETKYTNNGTPISSWPIAVDSGYGDNKQTSWITCKLWKREGVVQSLTKGQQIGVTGELTVRLYDRQDGTKGTAVDLTVRELTLCGSKNAESGTQRGQDGSTYGNGQRTQPRPAQNATGAFPSASEDTDGATF